jgi:hypothetical protein
MSQCIVLTGDGFAIRSDTSEHCFDKERAQVGKLQPQGELGSETGWIKTADMCRALMGTSSLSGVQALLDQFAKKNFSA